MKFQKNNFSLSIKREYLIKILDDFQEDFFLHVLHRFNNNSLVDVVSAVNNEMKIESDIK